MEMQTPPLQQGVRTRADRSSRAKAAQVQSAAGMSIASQERDTLELAVELIEMRYREYCAREQLEALIAEGGMGCL